MDSQNLKIEALRLLIYVAWVDSSIMPDEYDYLLAMAQRHNLPEEELHALEAAVRDPAKIVRPDFEVLKPYRNEVFAEVSALIQADDKIARAEEDLLQRLAEQFD